MPKIFVIAWRDFLATVSSKPFLFGLIIFPVLFGGGFAGLALMQSVQNTQSPRIAILDRTGIAADTIIRIAQEKNRRGMYDKATGRRVLPTYQFETITSASGDGTAERESLSGRVRRHELYAFVDIGPEALDPPQDSPAGVGFYSGSGGIDQFRQWFAEPLNDGLRRVRLARAGIAPDRAAAALRPVSLESMSLVSRDPRTGALEKPRVRGQAESFAIPFVLVLMMAMIVLMCASPMLTSVAEDKLQRVYEMLLASATPFELIMGKVIAGIGRSLASSVFYIIGGILTLQGLAMFGLVPFSLLPWFLVYLICEVALLSAMGAAVGSACASPQDAQHLVMLVLAPVMIPLVLMGSLLQQPNGPAATVLSFIPPFTPLVMLLRQAVPGGVPAWEPWVGLAGVLLCTLAGVWAAARIFRIGILFQGTTPKVGEILRWAVRG